MGTLVALNRSLDGFTPFKMPQHCKTAAQIQEGGNAHGRCLNIHWKPRNEPCQTARAGRTSSVLKSEVAPSGTRHH
jgi:hypothetical protein